MSKHFSHFFVRNANGLVHFNDVC